MATSSAQPQKNPATIVDMGAIEAARSTVPIEPTRLVPATPLPTAPVSIATAEELAARATAEAAATDEARAVIAASSPSQSARTVPAPLGSPMPSPVLAVPAAKVSEAAQTEVIDSGVAASVPDKPVSDGPADEAPAQPSDETAAPALEDPADKKNHFVDEAVKKNSIIPKKANIDSILAFMQQTSFKSQKVETSAVSGRSTTSAQGPVSVPAPEEMTDFPLSAPIVEATIAAGNVQPDRPVPENKVVEQPTKAPDQAKVATPGNP